ncbi:sigma-70 family RNA polymerase sigma factor [Brevibacterium casei]|uniref:RNA polymerase sigma factor n=1 Tax=Brevibacterium casei TaxID=33889 RepID=UPI00223B3B05|nr:sigma-70 family RNA polymerase sigma factor [Brevibacterium casei]MCT1447907.1 sigma-70 family RNA polymerase sigma factor [Brevibacterium casei]
MTESPSPTPDDESPVDDGGTATDAELVALIREHTPDSASGRQAFAELYARHHDPALHYAIRLTGDRPRAEDAVAEAFAKIWRAWGNGAGPEDAFKSYLMTAVRSESYRCTATTSATTAVLPEVLDVLAGSSSRDHANEIAEREHLARAFSSLPETWQTAITLIDIDGTPTAEAAGALGLSPNSFNSLLRRAREGLRTAYLQELVEPARPACAAYSSELARYVRKQLGRRRGASIETHLRHCQYCRRQTLLLGRINTKLGAWLTPAVLAAALIESEQFPAVPPVAAANAGAEPAGAESAGAEPAGAQNSETVFFSSQSGSGAAGSPSGLALGLKIAAAALIATAAIAATVWALDPSPNAPEVEGPTSSPVQPETGLADDDPGEDLRSPVAPPAADSPDAAVPAVPANEGPRNPAPAPPAPGEPGGPNAAPPAPRDPGPNNPGPGDPGPGDPGPGRPAPPPPTDPPPSEPPPTSPPPTEPPPTSPPPTEPPPTSPPPTSPPPTEPPPTEPPPTSPPPTEPPPTSPPTPSPTPTEPGDNCHDVGWGWHCH